MIHPASCGVSPAAARPPPTAASERFELSLEELFRAI
jgi:hypothetical protein